MGFFATHRPDRSAAALYDSAASRWYSYGELYDQIDRWAERFGGSAKALAFCFTRNDVTSVAAYLGALESGCAIALLPANLPPEFQSRLIDAYQPEWVIDGIGEPLRTDTAGGPVHPALAVLLSTSGSTGSPKFVRLTLDNVRSNACSIAEALRLTPASRAIGSLPLHYSYGLSVLNSHLIRGASVVLTDAGLLSPVFWNLVREQQCDSFAGVPYSYQVLDRLGLDRLHVPSIRTLTQAGGKLNPELIVRFHEAIARRGGHFFTMYGQTEAAPRIATLPPEYLPRKAGSVGFAIPGGAIRIEQGEVVYSGPNVMMGYAECRADLSAGDVLGGTLRTGDLGHIDDEGLLYITGRLKREAKLFGLRVNLDEIESMVRVHGPAAIVAGADCVSIYCEFEEKLFPACRDELASKLRIHAHAFDFHRIDRIPTKASGKVDYSALEARP